MKNAFKLVGIIVFLTVIGGFIVACDEPAKNKEENKEGYAFELISGNTEYSISLGKAKASGEIKLPASYKKLPVTAIADNAFASCVNMTGITIPNKVTRIGDKAFDGCTSLVKVTFTSIITESGFSSVDSFPGDLRDKYIIEGIRTYSRTSGSSIWTGTPPGIPAGVTAITEYFNSIVVSWSSVTGATGYKIYRSTSAADTFTEVGTSVTTSFTDTGLTASTTYHYKVAAANSGGPGTQSDAVNATTMPLPLEMVPINFGAFTMGSPESEPSRDSDETQHGVTISKSFYMGKYQVTQELYHAVMGINPSYLNGESGREPAAEEKQSRRPVETVSWYDAIVFCNRLSTIEGLTPAYQISGSTNPDDWGEIPASSNAAWDAVTADWDANGYRLPTEAEWEYACRAGTTTAYNTENTISDTGWYDSNSGNKTHEVGLKLPNAWGLHDMHGNVSEWCWDWYGDYPSEAQTNPRGAASGSTRVFRGGSWYDYTRYLRSAYRSYDNPSRKDTRIGFRLVRP